MKYFVAYLCEPPEIANRRYRYAKTQNRRRVAPAVRSSI